MAAALEEESLLEVELELEVRDRDGFDDDGDVEEEAYLREKKERRCCREVDEIGTVDKDEDDGLAVCSVPTSAHVALAPSLLPLPLSRLLPRRGGSRRGAPMIIMTDE